MSTSSTSSNRGSGITAWTWSAIRPSVVVRDCAGQPDEPRHGHRGLRVHQQQLGLPLRFPGKPGAYGSLLEMTDAGLLAKATVWAATDPAGANQAFNIANGDLFRWSDMWPRIAALLRARGRTTAADVARRP